MLYKVMIENFFSIADCQELSFEVSANAPSLACFKSSVSRENTRLPVVVGFFGPNASGKSTILRAISSAVIFMCRSFDWQNQINVSFQPYRRKDWWGLPTKITIEFDARLNPETAWSIFRYELHIAHTAGDYGNKTVSYEALSYSPQGRFKFLFKRENQDIHFGSEFGITNKHDPRKESVRSDASVISTLAKLNHALALYLSQIIGGRLQTNVIGVNTVRQNPHQEMLSNYANNQDCLEQLNQELRRFDLGLEKMVIEPTNQGNRIAKLHHEGLDSHILLPEESSGTQRFIEIFPRLHYVLGNGGIAIMDEIDTDLHSEVLPQLFSWFSSPQRNSYGAQLLFTAHNPVLLDELQKEEVFFTEKPSGKATLAYGARDIKGLRREPSLMRKYLAGELGALPHIG